MKRIYLDSCVFIYHLTNDLKLGEVSSRYFLSAERGRHEIIASSLVLHEVMSGIYKFSKESSGEIYSLLRLYRGVSWVDYSLEMADISAQLRSKTSLKTPDCIHLASALISQCEDFVTNDKQVKKYEDQLGIRVSLV